MRCDATYLQQSVRTNADLAICYLKDYKHVEPVRLRRIAQVRIPTDEPAESPSISPHPRQPTKPNIQAVQRQTHQTGSSRLHIHENSTNLPIPQIQLPNPRKPALPLPNKVRHCRRRHLPRNPMHGADAMPVLHRLQQESVVLGQHVGFPCCGVFDRPADEEEGAVDAEGGVVQVGGLELD